MVQPFFHYVDTTEKIELFWLSAQIWSNEELSFLFFFLWQRGAFVIQQQHLRMNEIDCTCKVSFFNCDAFHRKSWAENWLSITGEDKWLTPPLAASCQHCRLLVSLVIECTGIIAIGFYRQSSSRFPGRGGALGRDQPRGYSSIHQESRSGGQGWTQVYGESAHKRHFTFR